MGEKLVGCGGDRRPLRRSGGPDEEQDDKRE